MSDMSDIVVYSVTKCDMSGQVSHTQRTHNGQCVPVGRRPELVQSAHAHPYRPKPAESDERESDIVRICRKRGEHPRSDERG